MRQLPRVVGGLIGPVALMILALLFAWILAGTQQPSVMVSPTALATEPVTTAAYPPPPLPSVTAISSPYPPPPVPTATLQSTPSPGPTIEPTAEPTAIPTASALPEGPTVLYKELQGDSVLIWAASASNPNLRRSIFTIQDESHFGTRVSFSHDKTKIAFTKLPLGQGNNPLAGELWLAGLDGSQPELLASQVDIGRYINYPIWSSNDQKVAFSRQTALERPYTQSIAIVDIANRQEQVLVTASDTTWLWPLDWSPDGQYFYYLSGNGSEFELRRVNLSQNNTSESIRLVAAEMAPRCYFLSPDGGKLLCTVLQTRDPLNYAVVIIPLDQSGQPEILVSGAQDELYNPVWGPTGQEIALNIPPESQDGQAQLQIINLQSRRLTTVASSQEVIFVAQSWSMDGQWIVAKKFTSSGSELLLISSDGSDAHSISSPNELEPIGWLR